MDILLQIFGNGRLVEYYRALREPRNIKMLFEYREKVIGSKYSKNSRDSFISRLHVRGYIDSHGSFTSTFYDELKQKTEHKEKAIEKIKEYVEDVEIKDTIDLSSEMTLKDIFQMISKNINVKFDLSPELPIQNDIDFGGDNLQIVNINNLSHHVRYPQYFKYTYVCPKCGIQYSFLEQTTYKCEECKIKTKIDYNLSESRPCYIYMLDYNNEQYVTRSLVELPMGDFTAAVFSVKDLKSYTFFIVQTRTPKKKKVDLVFNNDTDRLHQLVDIIDGICSKQIGKKIYGMTYYKYAIMLSYLASLTGMTTYNIQIVGSGGLGKTSTPRLYLSTITQKVKIQDCQNLSKPGVRGSTKQIKIENYSYTVHEPGLMERNNVVVLDEMLDSTTDENMFLKSTLGANTMSVEIANYRTEVKKNAVAISTGNVPRWVREKRNMHLLKDEDPQIEFLIQNLWYLDGQNLNLLDRFAILFYVKETTRTPDFNTKDLEISDVELRQKLYSKEVDNYFKKCAKLQPFIPEDIKTKLAKFCSTMYDPIHSMSRRELYVSMTVQLHAMINGRNIVTVDDIKFLKSYYDKGFVEINTNVLDMEPGEYIKKFDEFVLKTVLATLGIAGKSQIRIVASKDYDMKNFEEVFENCLHYGEIAKIAPDRYRCTGVFDM